MKLIFPLPNGEELDLLDEGPNGMEYICDCSREFSHSISELLEIYQQENSSQRRLQISDEIRDQAYYFAGQIGAFDENLQQLIDYCTLGEQIYQCLITFAKIWNVKITANTSTKTVG